MSDIQALEEFAAYLRNAIEDKKTLLALQERHLKEVEDAIDAARLQAWYAENPGVELEVGDELAVTDEFRENRRLYNGLEDYIENGIFVAAVYEFDGEYRVSITPLHQQTGCTIDIDTARRMREAWLAKEAQS